MMDPSRMAAAVAVAASLLLGVADGRAQTGAPATSGRPTEPDQSSPDNHESVAPTAALRSRAETIDAPYERPAAITDHPPRDTLFPVGLGLSVGGGFTGFLDDHFNGRARPGGGWKARLLVATDAWVGGELSYVGTANRLDDVARGDTYLVSNGVQAALRLSLVPLRVRPYVLAGLGWTHYSVDRDASGPADGLRDADNVLALPLAVGIAYEYGRLFSDLRTTFSPAFDDELVRSTFDDGTDLSTWKVDATIGIQF